jgi:hypothetical protein
MFGSSYMFRHYFAILRESAQCILRDAQLKSSRQNIVDGRVVSSDVVRGELVGYAAQFFPLFSTTLSA